MPIFEFVCEVCGNPFEELVRSAGATGEVVCPVCGSDQVKKQLSIFAAKVTGGRSGSSYSSVTTGSCSSSGSV